MRDARGNTGDRSIVDVRRRVTAMATVGVLLALTSGAYAADETTAGTAAPSPTTLADTTTTTRPDPVPGETETPDDDQRLPTPPTIIFPVLGDHSFVDTFGAPRDGGRRQHNGNDIFAAKGTPIVAVADGVIETMRSGDLAGQYIVLQHDDGWRSLYLHLNNDTVGTDDGLGVGYATGIDVGTRVTAGTIIGYVGDSGNAESSSPHLHFELHQPDGLRINPFDALISATHVELSGQPVLAEAGTSYPEADTHNTALVGYLDPDGAGFNADITIHGDHVFVGTWGRPGRCPGTGVRVIDVSDPTDPVKVGVFAGGDAFPGTGAETVWVGEIETEEYAGTVAVVGLRLCENNWRGRLQAEFAGLAVYDLTDASRPELLSMVHSGAQTQGVHDVDVISSDNRALAAVTVPQSSLHDLDGKGDVRILDLSDPSEPVELADWDLRRDGPPAIVAELMRQVGDEALSAHSIAWVDSTTVMVAHSAAGLISLDVSDPTRPRFMAAASPYDTFDLGSKHQYGQGHGHNAHSGWLYDGWVLIQDDQQLEPLPDEGGGPGEWGQQVMYDFTEPTDPVLLSVFATENAVAGEDGVVGRDGYYTAHTSVPYGDDAELVAWFSDGVRVVDLSDPSNPTETAYFVPPPRVDPQGWWVAPDGTREIPMVWGVATDDRLVYASDLNSGIWIFKVIIREPLASSQVSAN